MSILEEAPAQNIGLPSAPSNKHPPVLIRISALQSTEIGTYVESYRTNLIQQDETHSNVTNDQFSCYFIAV